MSSARHSTTWSARSIAPKYGEVAADPSLDVTIPADLETEYGFYGGHIFHGELALDQLFAARPLLGYARYDSPIRGLYLCGAGTHPGGFLTGTSGRLAAHTVLKAHGSA